MLWIHVSAIDVHEEDGEPSENVLTEVRSYFEQQKVTKPANRDTRHTYTCASEGELIAIKLMQCCVRDVCVSCSCQLWRYCCITNIHKKVLVMLCSIRFNLSPRNLPRNAHDRK